MKTVIFIFISLISFSALMDLNAQVAINNSSTSPDPSAQLDISSTEKGMLIPRMTREERNDISSPATGLIIFQSNENAGFYYYDGSSWIPVGKEVIAIDDLLDGIGDNNNVFLGNGSGLLNEGVNNNNVGVGIETMANNSTGIFNSTLGHSALYSNTIGSYNTALGASALYGNSIGYSNVAVGNESLWNNLSGSNNVALGTAALRSNQSKSNLVAVGDSALFNNNISSFPGIQSQENTAIGSKSLFSNTSGYYNTAVGYRSMYSNSGGSSNVAIGWRALDSNTSGASNVALGLNAMRMNTTGHGNSANGYGALANNSHGDYNTAHGYLALLTNLAGNYNSAVGYKCLYFVSTGNYNTALGSSSLLSMATGDNNVALGAWADQFNQGGSNNVTIGFEAGRQINYHNASGNVFIGYRAGYNSLGNNRLYIENSESESPLIYGEFDNNKVKINGDCKISGEITINNYTLPAEDGTTGQVLETDGSGNVNWTYPSQLHYVGELIGTNGEDGIVFWVDQSGEHGLICTNGSLNSVTGIQWYNGSNVLTGASSDFDGQANTDDIIAEQGAGSYAASLCADYSSTNTNVGDWYLPSIQEFKELVQSIYEIYRATNFDSFLRLDYWTSTEFSNNTALSCDLDGVTSYSPKSNLYRVVAIRAF